MHITCDYPHIVPSITARSWRQPYDIRLPTQPRTLAAASLDLTSDKIGDNHIHSEAIHTHVHVNSTMSQTQTHTDSVDGQEHDEVQKKVKSRRPASKHTTFTFMSPKHR